MPRRYLKLLSVPIILLLSFLSLALVWELFNLPSTQVIGEAAGRLFETYGLPIVFVAAFLEGMLLIGNYFPGAFIIVLGVVLSGSIGGALGVLIVGTAGLMLSHAFNYYLGKHGWFRLFQKFGVGRSIDESKEKILKKGGLAIFFTYWNPSMAAVVDTAAGLLKMPAKRFFLISLISSIFWNTLVAAVAYILGDRALEIITPGSPDLVYIIGIFIVWCAVLLFIDWRRSRTV
jgi:membrane protein DedA with SNARE-associated domain